MSGNYFDELKEKPEQKSWIKINKEILQDEDFTKMTLFHRTYLKYLVKLSIKIFTNLLDDLSRSVKWYQANCSNIEKIKSNHHCT